MKVIENYGRAIENSDEYLFKQIFAPQVRVEIPAGAIFDQPANAAAYQLSQVAKTAPGIRCTLTAEAANSWSLLVFEGELDGQKLQAIDQVHLDKDGKIDHIIIYMRPTPVAQKFAVAISQRLQPTR
jgi:hypothetical protein